MGIPFIGSSVKVGKYGKIVMNDGKKRVLNEVV
jgi:hypothetical protein